MKKEVYKVNNDTMVRISKREAIKRFNSGEDIHIAMVNANMMYLNTWNIFGWIINNQNGVNFDCYIDTYVNSPYREHKNMGTYCKYFVLGGENA